MTIENCDISRLLIHDFIKNFPQDYQLDKRSYKSYNDERHIILNDLILIRKKNGNKQVQVDV